MELIERGKFCATWSLLCNVNLNLYLSVYSFVLSNHNNYCTKGLCKIIANYPKQKLRDVLRLDFDGPLSEALETRAIDDGGQGHHYERRFYTTRIENCCWLSEWHRLPPLDYSYTES
jgi:hypothetical protein